MSSSSRPIRPRSASVLAQPIRLRVLIGLLALQWPVLAVLLAVPMVLAAADGQWPFAMRLAVMGVPVAAAAAITVLWPLPRPRSVRRIEALATASLTFLISAALFVWPFMGFGLRFELAAFEAMSGITTTGLTMVGDIESWPWSAQITRSWLQWCGGFGMVVAALALVMTPGSASRRLGRLGLDERDILASTRARAREVMAVYAALTGACLLSLLIVTGSPVDAAVHALSAVSTGGFSNRADSLESFPVLTQSIILLFGVTGAVSLALYPALLRSRGRSLLLDRDVHWLLGLIAAGTLLICLFEWIAGPGGSGQSVLALASHVVSAQTNSGFTAAPITGLSSMSVLLIVLAMAIGGDVGSTAGGIKIIRFAILAAVIRLQLLRTQMPPHAVTHVRRHGRKVSHDDIVSVIAVIVLFLALDLFSWLVFLGYGYDPVDSLFEVVSATATVGLSRGITGPDMPVPLIWLQTLNMWFGRLEIIAVLILFWPGTWIKFGRA